MVDIFEHLKERGKVTTSGTSHLEENDVRALALEIKRLEPDHQGLLIHLLKGYLHFFHNRVMDGMLDSGDLLIPRSGPKPIIFIEPEDLRQILDTKKEMPGWYGAMYRGMVSLYFATGLGPSELRKAELEDLDLKMMRIFVRHPKGESNWASKAWADIIWGDMVPMIVQYVKEGESYLLANNASKSSLATFEVINPYLFPCLRNDTGFNSNKTFRKLKKRISKASGVTFRLKDFRSMLTIYTVNGNLSRPTAMGVQLRHGSPETTKKVLCEHRPLHGRGATQGCMERDVLGAPSGCNSAKRPRYCF